MRAATDRVTIKMHVFIQFLTHHNVLDQWMENVLKHSNDRVLNTVLLMRNRTGEALGHGFGWSDTPQGYVFWSQLGSRWEEVDKEIDKVLSEDITYVVQH